MKPQRLDALLEAFLNDPRIKRGILRAKVFNAYIEITKDTFGDGTEPTGFKNGVLYVEVESSPMLNDISFFEETIVEEINKKLGERAVKKIKFKVKEDK